MTEGVAVETHALVAINLGAEGVAEETRALVATNPVAARAVIITMIIPLKKVEGPTVIHPLLANTVVQTNNYLK
jgi:hypothetical protein